MGSHSVTCHPTQVNAPRFNPSQIGRYSIYLPRRDGKLSWPRRLDTYRDGSQEVTHRSINRARRTVTSLIRSNALPLHHATTLNKRRYVICWRENLRQSAQLPHREHSCYGTAFLLSGEMYALTHSLTYLLDNVDIIVSTIDWHFRFRSWSQTTFPKLWKILHKTQSPDVFSRHQRLQGGRCLAISKTPSLSLSGSLRCKR